MKTLYIYDFNINEYNDKYYLFSSFKQDKYISHIDILGDINFLGIKKKDVISQRKNDLDRFELRAPSVYICKSYFDTDTIRNAILDNNFIIIRMPSTLGIIASYYCRKYKKKYCMEVVGNAFEALWYIGRIKTRLLAPYFHFLTKYSIKKCRNVAYITQNYLQTKYPTNGKVYSQVANVSIKNNEYCDIEQKIALLESKNENSTWNIGLVGGLDVKYKGQDVAINALSVVIQKHPSTYLHLLGKGEKRDLERLAKKLNITDNVLFDGTRHKEDMPKWFDQMDIYIQPSKTEAHGRSIVEACSRGCICFGANVGGIGDTLPADYLFKQNDYRMLAKMIDDVITNKNKRCTLSKRCFQQALIYSYDKIEQNRHLFLFESSK